MPDAKRFRTNSPGREILVWAAVDPRGEKTVVSLSFGGWNTREEAIEAYSKQCGKTWEQLEAKGAKVVQKKGMVFDKTGP